VRIIIKTSTPFQHCGRCRYKKCPLADEIVMGSPAGRRLPKKLAIDNETVSRRIASKAYYSRHSILTLYRNGCPLRMCLKNL
ncbi:MAG: hypothetical protein ACE1ZI_05840, partial [Acidobacteriota bacterium]